MKKILFILMACLALVSCETEAPSSTQPTPLNVTVTGIESFAAYVTVEPQDARAYYVSSVMEAAEYNNLGYADSHYMMLVLDSLYANYLVWRHSYLRDNTTYFADFKSHCLLRGTTTDYYGFLNEETDYMVLTFCVNPISMQPMGNLQKAYFRTTEKDTVTANPMQIDFYLRMYEEDGDYHCLASVRPSIDGKPTKSPYFVATLTEDELQANYGGDVMELAKTYASMIDTHGNYFSGNLHSDIYMEYLEKSLKLEPGKSFYVLAAPNTYTWAKSLFYIKCTYEPGKTISYTHTRYGE